MENASNTSTSWRGDGDVSSTDCEFNRSTATCNPSHLLRILPVAEEDGGNKRVMPLPRKYVVCREVLEDLEYARLLKQACEEATGEEFAILVLEADKGGRWLTLKEIED